MIGTYSKYTNLKLDDIPDYAVINWEEFNDDPIENIYTIREKYIEGLAFSSAMTYRQNNTATRFYQLAFEVEEDCKMCSSTNEISMHQSYQEIIGMGNKVIPLLLKKLDESPIFWFKALESITGVNPVPDEYLGNVPMQVKYWKKWVIENELSRFGH